MRAAVVIVSVALLAIAAARCPNSCSGHGDCGGSDKCTCWANWQGFDCSERTCEYDVAWATDARQNPHYYAECSGKGVCDRTTGLCTCFDGYTGSACRRSVCPNDCSGHGKCRLVAELDDANSAQSLASNGADTLGSVAQYGQWDGDKIQACVCDGGFFGPDCSQRNCPKGDDPLTICNDATKQIQTLKISTKYKNGAPGALTAGVLGGDFRGELVLHFTDSEGEVWTTSRIGDTTTNSLFTLSSTQSSTSIKNALAALPNFKIPAVSIDPASCTSGTGSNPSNANEASKYQTWAVTFSNERNSGVQSLLACDPLPLGCQTAGCSPMYRQPKSWSVSASETAPNWASHYRVEYSESHHVGTDPGAFMSSTIATSISGGTPVNRPSVWDSTGTLSTTMNSFITADSILDNSALWSAGAGAYVDQANVLIRVYKFGSSASLNVNWGARESDTYAYYTVEWNFDTPALGSAGGAAPTSSCGTAGEGCPTLIKYIPTGKADNTLHTAVGSTDTGVGYNHAPIGHGLYVNFGNAVASLETDGYHQELWISFTVGTVRCDVTAAAPSPQYEHLECSGRGSCDRTTGTCTCFEGHYGDHCGMQTILV